MHLASLQFSSQVAFQTCALLAAAWLFGRFCGKTSLGAASWGAFVLIAATAMVYLLFSRVRIHLSLFAPITLVVSFLLSGVIRQTTSTRVPYEKRASWGTIVALVITVVSVIWARTCFRSEPNAGSNFFQAWDPLYLKHSLQSGILARTADMSFGEGFLTDAMEYAPNIRPITLLLGIFNDSNLFVCYVAAGCFTVSAALVALFDTLRGQPVFSFVFAFLFVSLGLSYSPFGYFILSPASDEVLLFSGALAANSLVTAERGFASWRDAFIALGLGVIGRNYGGFYAALAFLPMVYYARRETVPLRRVLPGLLVVGMLAGGEIQKLIIHGDIFYPRVSLPQTYPRSLSGIWWGTLCDWGLMLPNSEGTREISPLYTVWLVFMASVLAVPTNRAKIFLISTVPIFYFLFMPFILELLTGYRKTTGFTKPYIVSAWLFSWFPVYCVSLLLKTRYNEHFQKSRLRTYASIGIASVALFGLGRAHLRGSGHGFNRFRSIDEVMSDFGRDMSNLPKTVDEQMAQEIVRLPNRTNQELVAAKIMYFHYEPGIGLRWHIGGDFLGDLDYWSKSVQANLKDDTGLREFMESQHWPVLYLSRGFDSNGYGGFQGIPDRKKLWGEIRNWKSSGLFEAGLEKAGALMLIPREDLRRPKAFVQ